MSDNLEEQRWAALDNDNILMEGLRKGLVNKGITPTEELPEIPDDSSGSYRNTSSDQATSSRRVTSTISHSEGASTYEQALLTLGDVRDDLISVFSQVAHNKEAASALVKGIRKVEGSIGSLGGSVSPFNPLTALSGLASKMSSNPEAAEAALLANALKVSENTKANYSLFEIPKMIVKTIKEKPAILLQVTGTDQGKPFVVNATILAKSDFTGSESIDYVREEGQQMFAVKMLRLGQWVDVSADYTIRLKDVTP